VLEEYGVKHEAGFPERAYFAIDQEGVVRAKEVEDSPGHQPEVEEVRSGESALELLESRFR
jgi:mycoredoxin-dependent peroxiredoxin